VSRPRGTGPDVTVPGGPPGDGSCGGRNHTGRRGGVCLPGSVTGAAVLAGPALARMLDGEPGIQQEVMRFQVETATRVHQPGRSRPRPDPAPAAGRRRLGVCGLPAGGIGDRAVSHARAGRPDGPAPVPGPGAEVRPAGGPGRAAPAGATCTSEFPPRPRRPGTGAAAAVARAAAGHHRQLTHRGRPRHRLGQSMMA
jgi:hypothetical protein